VLGHSFDVNFGFSGMARLAADLRATRGKSSWRSRFGEHLDYAMGRVVDGVARQLTAADATRPIYADFLAEATPMLGLARVPEAVESMRASGRAWADVGRVAASATPGTDPGPVFDELADLVDEALRHEQQAVASLQRP
jgi:hypothetical protein